MTIEFDIPNLIQLDQHAIGMRAGIFRGLIEPALCDQIANELLDSLVFKEEMGMDRGYAYKYLSGGQFYSEQLRRRFYGDSIYDPASLPALTHNILLGDRMLQALKVGTEMSWLSLDQVVLGFNAMHVGDYIGPHQHWECSYTAVLSLVPAVEGGRHLYRSEEQQMPPGTLLIYPGQEWHEVTTVTATGRRPRMVAVYNIPYNEE